MFGGVKCQQGPRPDRHGATPLFIAAEKGHLEVVRCLVVSGADKDQGMTDYEATPPFIAARHLEVVRFLVGSRSERYRGLTCRVRRFVLHRLDGCLRRLWSRVAFPGFRIPVFLAIVRKIGMKNCCFFACHPLLVDGPRSTA